VKTIFFKGCEYKQGINNLFFWKSSLNQWKKATNQKQIEKLWAEKQHRYLDSDARLISLLETRGPLTCMQITQTLNLSVSGGKSFVGRLNQLGLVEKKGLFRNSKNGGRSSVMWGLVA